MGVITHEHTVDTPFASVVLESAALALGRLTCGYVMLRDEDENESHAARLKRNHEKFVAYNGMQLMRDVIATPRHLANPRTLEG